MNMPEIAVDIQGLGKSYLLQHQGKQRGYVALRDVAVDAMRGVYTSTLRLLKRQERVAPQLVEEFWALRDVSFQIRHGEVVGIIGRNGAGKSTLLKVLSRITEPTRGRVKLRGRVASLLEVGTGFHPELTGRENIFLNGSILGMTRAEIRQKFDEIVAFSEVEKFLDTPVKRYSSGMYVRLAFAVAAHLEPEILIVDEVLAVGDGDFQKKCLGKMESMHGQGRTVIVVSHQLSMITALCDRGVVIKNGAVDFIGSASEAVLHYQPSDSQSGQAMFDASLLGKTIGDERAQLLRAWTENDSGQLQRSFDLGSSIMIKMEYRITQDAKRLRYPNFHLYDERGEYVLCTAAHGLSIEENNRSQGEFVAECTIPAYLLNTGTYYIGVALTVMDPGVIVSFFERDALSFQVTEDLDATLDSYRNGYAGVIPGVVRPRLDWKVTKIVNSIPENARAGR